MVRIDRGPDRPGCNICHFDAGVSQFPAQGPPIEEAMTSNVITIGEEASLEEARRLIVEHAVRHLPVVNSQGELVGLLSVRKLLDEFFGLQSSKYC